MSKCMENCGTMQLTPNLRYMPGLSNSTTMPTRSHTSSSEQMNFFGNFKALRVCMVIKGDHFRPGSMLVYVLAALGSSTILNLPANNLCQASRLVTHLSSDHGHSCRQNHQHYPPIPLYGPRIASKRNWGARHHRPITHRCPSPTSARSRGRR